MIACHTIQTNRLTIGTRSKTACIFEQGSHTLVLLHLIGHRTLHITCDIHDTVERTNHDDIIVCQTDIAREFTIEDIIIKIDRGYLAPPTEDLDVTQRTDAIDTACHIQGMENRGKGREGISSRRSNLTHDIHTDGAGLTNRQTDLRTLITSTESLFDTGIGLSHRETTYMNRTIACSLDRTIGRDLELLRLLRSAIDIDKHFITRTNDIVGWGGNVHVRFK